MMERWRAGRFPSLPLAIADAVFSKQKDYRSAVRTATRPFATAFAQMPLPDFCSLDQETVFKSTFERPARSGKEGSHLSPEGRIRSIREASLAFLEEGILTPEEARRDLGIPPTVEIVSKKLQACFGIGGDMLANIRMNVGVLTVKPDVHVRAFLAPYLGLQMTSPAHQFETKLNAAREVLGLDPFEVDQIIWYTQAASGRTR